MFSKKNSMEDVFEAMWLFWSYVASFTGAINSVQIPFECPTHESCSVPAKMTDGCITDQAKTKNAALSLIQDSDEG